MDQDYIDDVIESYFRRGSLFFYDILKLTSQLKKKQFDYAFILEKTKGPAIACTLAKINKIYGSKAQSKNWSASEKEKILEALRKYGTADIPKLQTAVPNRSQEAIKTFVEREKVKMTQVYREIILPDGRMKVK